MSLRSDGKKIKKGGKARNVCRYCTYSTRKTSKLAAHVESEHRHAWEKAFGCPHCVYSSSREGKVRRHVMSDHVDAVESTEEDYKRRSK